MEYIQFSQTSLLGGGFSSNLTGLIEGASKGEPSGSRGKKGVLNLEKLS